MYSELRQVASAYPYNGDIMLMSNKGIVITDKEKKRLESSSVCQTSSPGSSRVSPPCLCLLGVYGKHG